VLGADVDFGETGLRADVLLFNETQSRIIVSVKRHNAAAALALLEWRGVPARRLGSVAKSDSFRISADGKTFGWSLAELDAAWSQSIERFLRGEIQHA
jgi:phosphoribosylformylglycinamidine synthase